jgi:hypothetical protein
MHLEKWAYKKERARALQTEDVCIIKDIHQLTVYVNAS